MKGCGRFYGFAFGILFGACCCSTLLNATSSGCRNTSSPWRGLNVCVRLHCCKSWSSLWHQHCYKGARFCFTASQFFDKTRAKLLGCQATWATIFRFFCFSLYTLFVFHILLFFSLVNTILNMLENSAMTSMVKLGQWFFYCDFDCIFCSLKTYL